MAQLICTYASERSQPEKIQRWISDLLEMREECGDDPVRTAMIDLLLGRARGWLEAKGVEVAA
jgi:hypothetical protein